MGQHSLLQTPPDPPEPALLSRLLRPNARIRWLSSFGGDTVAAKIHSPSRNAQVSSTAFKVAAFTQLRLSARIRQRQPRWIGHGLCEGRVARRLYGTVATGSGEATNATPRPWSGALQADPITAKPRSCPQFYVPSVLLPPEAAESPLVHKIHILGEDERSRFIAHALSGVYESVEMLGWRRNPPFSYCNMQKTPSGNRRGTAKLEPLAVTPRALAPDDDAHIGQLLVTGHGYEAAQALESVKHRINQDTAVCLMNDGLGVLEDVRRKLFAGAGSSPTFLLGHMSHRLAFNRAHYSVKELKHGQTNLTLASRFRDKDKTEARLNFVKTLREAKDLNLTLSSFDRWLRFKLPSVIFGSVVEPVCVLLDMPYQGLLQNPAAQRMMHRLLSEIALVVDSMPEVEGSTAIRDYVRGKGIRKLMYSQIKAKRSQPSQLVRQVQNGLPTDVEYMNGYFLRQARRSGLGLPMHVMMRDMIKAKHSLAVERLNSFIPLEETSIPSESHFRYRTPPR